MFGLNLELPDLIGLDFQIFLAFELVTFDLIFTLDGFARFLIDIDALYGRPVRRSSVRKCTFPLSLVAPVSLTAQDTLASFRNPFQTARATMPVSIFQVSIVQRSNANVVPPGQDRERPGGIVSNL